MKWELRRYTDQDYVVSAVIELESDSSEDQELRAVRQALAYLNTLVASSVEGRPALHCPTCQCARLHGVAPSPGNPNSKSWHENVEPRDARPDPDPKRPT
jgi:hypothetical protein